MKVRVELLHAAACALTAYLSFAFIEASFDITTWDPLSRWLTPFIAAVAFLLSKMIAGEAQ